MASNQDLPALSRDDYTIGWISALAIESAAAVIMLDEEHDGLSVAEGDSNSYSLGRIGEHNVVIACTNEVGGLPANITATNLMNSFRNVRYILTVGVGGGIPNTRYQVRLGDVVVSEPTGNSPGVVQSDFEKWDEEGGSEIKGSLNRPAVGLIRAIGAVKVDELLGRSKIHSFVKHLGGESSGHDEIWKYQGRENDPLYRQDSILRHDPVCTECREQQRPETPDPRIHYGIIASGNQVINNREQRDKLGDQLGACCVEMEAFGLMNDFPCLVIRGISSYADGCKDDNWQGYASITAAAYAKELLLRLPSFDKD
ncbi:hypothetical protein AOL_s00080g220 [Orbilia oligospora ATCC 24927]|uniref:Nucleoside phosphorylase domain-containing protein n=1 Tax=Arthrobotrys oligospora (strain ATCC 24927 / CBS 115.81 / DSM 1491) TaxID=756982 RepID=G1XEI5_ARTOA|nr:hypothetical protein AOL_s00080g220 [Orbilia oligospora ATCC 24927]EGX48591.1 hypothetical protein AOL_s00080g220 [Orbilia oligospora ATCC 24927]